MSDTLTEPYEVSPENAELVWRWLQERGGVTHWRSANLANPGASWSAPLYDEKGGLSGKPTWQAEDKPSRTITSPDDVVVLSGKEVKRFGVGVRRGGSGLSLKLTDASSRRLRQECAKHKDSWYEFDYTQQQAVIFVPDEKVPLRKFIENLEAIKASRRTIEESNTAAPVEEQPNQ